VIDCPASSAAAASMPSSAASAALRYFFRSFKRGPRVRKLGANSNWSTSPSSSATSNLVDVELLGHNVVEDRRRARRQEHEGAGEWLTHLDPASLRAARPSEVRRRANSIWASRSRFDEIRARARANDQVHGVAVVDVRHRTPHGVGHERAERRQQHGDVGQDLVQRGLRGECVPGRGIGIGTPEASPAAADVQLDRSSTRPARAEAASSGS